LASVGRFQLISGANWMCRDDDWKKDF